MTEETQNIIFIFLLVALLGIQLFWLFKHPNLKRRYLKFVLNILLWISIVLLIFPFEWNSNKKITKIGIKDNVVTSEFIEKIKDSLNIEKVISTNEYEKKYLDKNLETFLLGQNFEAKFLSNFAGKKVSQIPFFKKNTIQKLNWKGILKLNETQVIDGTINIEKSGILRLKFGNKTLDSLILKKRINQFSLTYPSFSIGKTGVEIYFEDEELSQIKYFSRPAPKLNVLILTENPDFEIKTLSDWLGKNGNSVEVQTAVAKNTLNNTTINSSKKDNYDLVIASPEKIGNPICKKTLKNGGALFIINLTENSVQKINKTFNSNLKIQRNSAEKELKLGNDLLALPYKFIEQTNQQLLNNLPIIATNERIGATLVSETYPLILSGDSLTYRKIWSGVLQILFPVQKNNISVSAPIISNLNTQFRFNNFDKNPDLFNISTDTIFTKTSPINSKTVFGNYIFRSENWQVINDSLEVFVNKNNEPYTNQIFTNTALNSYSNSLSSETEMKESLKETLPDWFRFLLCIIIFIFVWIEAKW